MAEVVLFHHAPGLTPGVSALAGELRRAGHAVHAPDLFGGRTFDTVQEGVSHAGELGFGAVTERGVRAAGAARRARRTPASPPACPRRRSWRRRGPERGGALLFRSCVPVPEFSSAWPAAVPVQVHAMNADPFFAGEDAAARALAGQATDAELFLYPAGSTCSPAAHCRL